VTDIGPTFLGRIQGLPDISVGFYGHSPAGAMDVLGEYLRYQEWEGGFYADSGVIVVDVRFIRIRKQIQDVKQL
jgi:hypothetical protein